MALGESIRLFESFFPSQNLENKSKFILAIEVLACRIWDDKGIKGILINEEEIKLTLFADDMTCFLRDIASYHRS